MLFLNCFGKANSEKKLSKNRKFREKQLSRAQNSSTSSFQTDSYEFPQREEIRRSFRNRSFTKTNQYQSHQYKSHFSFPNQVDSNVQPKDFEYYKSLPGLDYAPEQDNYYFQEDSRSIDVYDDSDLELNTRFSEPSNTLPKKFSRNVGLTSSRKSVTFDEQVKVKYDFDGESYKSEFQNGFQNGFQNELRNQSISGDTGEFVWKNLNEFASVDDTVFEKEIIDENMVRYEELFDERAAHMKTIEMYYKLQKELLRLKNLQNRYWI